ncbi:nucleotidyltransferase domain-containing protein [Candidatus Woesearchaeota archaeon]|nr:nucleotidyltransferase domain-containing protein [Candidatus Woesearchaeota archaeon]
MEKHDGLLLLFLEEPTRRWRFSELLRAAGMSRPRAALWLRRFIAGGLVRRMKERGRMPYYEAAWKNERYRVRKRLFALDALEQRGLLSGLSSLPADTVVLFGSMSRWDWHRESDVDIFVLGYSNVPEISRLERALGRKIDLFACKNRAALRKMRPPLLGNILEGYLLKGSLDEVARCASGMPGERSLSASRNA